ncbi:hypothetical protein NKG94_05915 [Micromonospora sp. M12]
MERGWLAYGDNRHDDATRDMQDALAVFERNRQGNGVGFAWEAMGEIADRAGRYEDAIVAFEAAAAQFERLSDRVHAARSRFGRASALATLRRVGAARAEWAAAEQLIGDATLPRYRRSARLRERLSEEPSAGK